MAFCAVVAALSNVHAQIHESYADRPARRSEAAQKALERAQHEKAAARDWARERGLPMRYMDGERVSELMAIRNGRPIYYTTLNKNAAISTAADQVRQILPFNATGSNLVVGVWDAGSVRSTHFEFGGRISLEDPGAALSSHSTHIAGTIGAAGINLNVRGMAPAVRIDSYDWNGDESEMIAAAAAIPGEAGKIYLSTHSYGAISGWTTGSYSGNSGYHWYGEDILDDESDQFGQYGAATAYWDEIVYDAPYFLPFQAAGNDRNDPAPPNGTTFYYYSGGWHSSVYNSAIHPPGDGDADGGYDTIEPKGSAKNVMTVGAVRDAQTGGVRDLSKATMEAYSGWGPTDDGRIKPDIVANGYNLYSTDDGSDLNYTYKSGTSMATPNACGSAALLIDYYAQRFPGEAMRASTLKGLIIHTADDLGNPGPDYTYGWGLMNTLAAAEMIRDFANGDAIRMTEDHLANNNKSDTLVFHSDGYDSIRVTLCWTDPPGMGLSGLDNRTSVLENDLDLHLTGPDGVHHPYSLSYASPSSNATADGKNDIDNIEQIEIEAPLAGTYTVTVDFDGLISGGGQWYSLFVSGNDYDSDGDQMSDHWEQAYFSSPTGAVNSVDSDEDGFDNFSEYIGGYDPTSKASAPAVTVTSTVATNAPFVLQWNAISGRVYTVSWSADLTHAFTNIAGPLYYPINSYTDTVYRADDQIFYRIGVELAP